MKSQSSLIYKCSFLKVFFGLIRFGVLVEAEAEAKAESEGGQSWTVTFWGFLKRVFLLFSHTCDTFVFFQFASYHSSILSSIRSRIR